MMNDLINTLLPSMEHLRMGAYWIAFFAAFLETTLIVGLFLPGSVVILFLGAASARGYADWGDLIWFAAMGAIVGDNINYFLGKKFGAKWLEKGFWFFKSQHIQKAERFMNTHGAKSVFLGRFIPSVKEIVPFIAGTLKMRMKTFLIWNVLGAIGWGFEWVLTGYIFAQSLNMAEVWLSRIGLFFALLFILIVIFQLLKWLLVKRGKYLFAIIGSLWESLKQGLTNNKHVAQWVQKHPHIVSTLKARLDPAAFTGLPLSILALAFLYVLSLFGGIVEDLITSDPIVAADIRIANLLTIFRTDTLTHVFTWITLLGKSQVVIVFIAACVTLMWVWRKKDYIPPLLVAIIGSEVFTYLGKLAFHRTRPELPVYIETSFSFPSGHATIAVAFYGFLIYFLIRFSKHWKRQLNLFFTGLLVVLAIGLSRIYLGEHYLSDVWSGYLVGLMWLIIAVSLAEWFAHKTESRPSTPVRAARILSFGLVLSAVTFYVGFALTYHLPLASATVQKSTVLSDAMDIFSHEQLKYTETLIGEKQEPVNFVVMSDDGDHLIKAFQQAGWTLAGHRDISLLTETVKGVVLHEKGSPIPISLSFWNAKIQDFSFVKQNNTTSPGHARHTRIWMTNSLNEDGGRIYIGMVNATNGVKWGMVPKISPDLDSERERLFQDLNQSGTIVLYQKNRIVAAQMGKNFIGDPFFTDGMAYMVTLR
jgi:membrane protein DedA with SNARE-associated domain/membrane-associated phospholipid phosphatase